MRLVGAVKPARVLLWPFPLIRADGVLGGPPDKPADCIISHTLIGRAFCVTTTGDETTTTTTLIWTRPTFYEELTRISSGGSVEAVDQWRRRLLLQ